MVTAVSRADRLAPAHYEPVRVPPEVTLYSSVPDTLAVGSPAKVGILDLEFAGGAGRTELVGRYQKTPLQLMRPLYFDPSSEQQTSENLISMDLWLMYHVSSVSDGVW